MSMEYPVYRKYPNDKSFFKINSESHFDELKLTGDKAEIHHFEAKIHPDRVFIQDMIAMENEHWTASTAKEFEEVLQRVS